MGLNNPTKKWDVCNSLISYYKKKLKLCTAQLMHHKSLLCGLDYKCSGDTPYHTCILSAKWKPVMKQTLRSLKSLLQAVCYTLCTLKPNAVPNLWLGSDTSVQKISLAITLAAWAWTALKTKLNFGNITADIYPEKNRIRGLCYRNVLPPSDKLSHNSHNT
jgi:hypothetical protein